MLGRQIEDNRVRYRIERDARLEIDAEVACLISLRATRFVAGDLLGQHWLEVVGLAAD
jgi:hypothetical protein